MRAKTMPPNPKSPDFEIPPSYSNTLKNDNFVVHDTIHSKIGGRLLVFSTKSLVEVLCGCETIFVDGTFKIRPTMFSQVYVIMGLYLDEGDF